VSAFEPFGGYERNSSQEALRAFARRTSRTDVVTATLPVVYGAATQALAEAIERAAPAIVVALGQADARATIGVERLAVNLVTAPWADEAGRQPRDEPVLPGGPPAYAATLPVEEVVRELHAAGIPAEASTDAGGFVCNHVFYGLMHLLAEDRRDALGGFLHLPGLPEQEARTGEPGMDAETLGRAVEIAVAVAARDRPS